MAQAYYGRAAAYDEALGKAAPATANAKTVTALAAVLQRNLYPDTPEAADVEKLKALASYLLALESELAAVTLNDILAGNF
jgi:hypothetical protein